MKKLLTNSITTTVGMPLKSGSLDHLQAAYTEALAEVGKFAAGGTYSANTVYILSGLVNSGSGLTYNISPGSVFYNGEVFLVDAASFTLTSLQFPVGSIVTSFFSDPEADPVQFTDGVNRNVHEIRKLQIAPSTTNAGPLIYTNYINLDRRLKGAPGTIIMWDYRTYGALTTFFDSSTGAGIHPYTLGWRICNGQGITPNMSGLMPIGYSSSDPDFNNPYTDTGGVKTVTLTEAQLPEIQPEFSALDGNDNLGGAGYIASSNNTTGGASDFHATITPFGGGEAHTNMPPYRAVLFVMREQ